MFDDVDPRLLYASRALAAAANKAPPGDTPAGKFTFPGEKRDPGFFMPENEIFCAGYGNPKGRDPGWGESCIA